MFSVADFKSKVSRAGFLQTNKYVVNISFPANNLVGQKFVNIPAAGGSKMMIDFATDLSYRCVNASLPGIILRTSDVNRHGTGVTEKMPFSAAYTDIDLTFLCDKEGAAYNFWYAWLQYIHASVGQQAGSVTDSISSGRQFYTTAYKDSYAGEVTVTTFSNSGKQAVQYKMYKAFPISINDSPLSWAENDTLLKMTVKITFREWAMDDGAVHMSNRLSSANTSSTILST